MNESQGKVQCADDAHNILLLPKKYTRTHTHNTGAKTRCYTAHSKITHTQKQPHGEKPSGIRLVNIRPAINVTEQNTDTHLIALVLHNAELQPLLSSFTCAYVLF